MDQKPYPAEKSAGRRDHPEYAGPPGYLSDRFDRRRCSGCCPDDRSLIARDRQVISHRNLICAGAHGRVVPSVSRRKL